MEYIHQIYVYTIHMFVYAVLMYQGIYNQERCKSGPCLINMQAHKSIYKLPSHLYLNASPSSHILIDFIPGVFMYNLYL